MRTFLLCTVAALVAAPAAANDEPPSWKAVVTGQNNIKQIGLAFHNFESANGFLPQDVKDKDGKPLLSWRVQILPYIEQDNVYKLARFDLPPIHTGRPTNYNGEDDVARALIKTYYCPSRRAPTGYGAALLGRCDYAGSAGFYQGEVHENWGDIPAPPIGLSPRRNERTPENFGDMGGRKGYICWSAQGAKRKIGDVIDGTSNSIMAAEKCLPPTRQGLDGGDNERWNNAGWDECVIRYHFPPKSDTDPTIIVVGQPSDPAANTWRRYFGSSHSGGLNAVFGDGSVKFIRFGVGMLAESK